MSKASFHHISPSGEYTPLSDFDEALKALSLKGYVWFDYVNASREELSELSGPLSLHPLSIEDCTDENQMPKIEDFSNYSFVIFNSLYYESRKIVSDEVDLFIGSNFIITVSGFSESSRNPLSAIDQMVRRNTHNIKSSPAKLAHLVLDNVVDSMVPVIDSIEEEIDAAEEEILDNPGGFDATTLLYLRRSLLSLRKSIFHEREILIKIVRNDSSFIPEKATVDYRDIYDHISNFLETTESNRDKVTSLMELYASMLNNKMARDSNLTNASVRRLTLITTIFMPMTLLAGIFGMSEWTMMTGEARWQISYPLFGILLLVIGLINFAVLKWLERND